MTSLEFIMDMEEDTPHSPPPHSQTINKNDGGSISPGPSRSQDPDPSRAATSRHEKLKDRDDRLTTATTRRRGHSSRSPKPTATASSSSTRPAPLSRRSTASSEPMDPNMYGGPIQGSSSGGMPLSNMPTRPMGSSPSEGNVPVKLTPITGRVSRAKKGVPVHTCDICKPSKTFTRAEHLRRHQLSHKNPGFPCTYPGCDKTFHRADLLARHNQRHEPDDKASSRGTADRSRPTSAQSDMSYIAHNPSVGGSVPRSGMPGPSDMSPGGTYPYHHSMDDPSGTSSGQTPMSPYPDRRGSYQPSSGAPSQSQNYTLSSMPTISNQPPSNGGSPVTGTPFGLGFLPRTSSPFSIYLDAGVLPQDLPSLTIPDNSLPPGLVHAGHDGSPWPSSASESTYSTPSEISHRRNIAREYESSPTSDWPNHGFYSGPSQHLHSPGPGLETIATSAPFFTAAFSPTASNIDHALGLPMPFSDDASFVEHPQQYHPYSSVRSPTPPTISLSAQPAETLVTLAAPSVSDAASMGGRQKGSAMLLGPLRGAAFLTANTLSSHVRNAIPKYLDVYWKRFDTLFPLVHRKSTKTAADEVLRCAMAAVGTQFLQGKEDRIRGNELHEFAWKEVNLCAQWTLPIMQAILLCEFYARFRGRSAHRNASEPFQSLYSRMANSLTPDDLTNPTPSNHDRSWNEWIETESRRRLLAACFILDVHTSVYYQQNLIQQFPISTHPIPLIRPTEDLWAAQSPEAWETLLGSRPTNAGPASLSGESPTAEQVANAPHLDHAVFLASEALRLPRRTSPSILDLSVRVDETSTEQISRLFPDSTVGNTYLALHYTPLHDLLAVSGDTWLFSKKVSSPQVFQQHKRRLQLWLGSPQADAAARFAAKALVAFLEHSNRNTLNSTVSRSDLKMEEDQDQDQDRSWNMSDISDYWAMYACALICWALGHRAMVRGNGGGSGLGTEFTTSSSPNPRYPNANAGEKGEREALKWLKAVAGLGADKVLNVRGRKEITGVVGMVKRRLEDEAVGGRSRLLVDAIRTLKNLEERVHHKWF